MKLTHLDREILRTLSEATTPLSTTEIKEQLEEEEMIYTQQYLKRRINTLLDADQVEFVAKNGRTELFTIPGKQIDRWESSEKTTLMKTNRVLINLSGVQYSPDQLIRVINNTDFSSVLNDKRARETKNQLMGLLLSGGADKYYNLHSIKPVKNFRNPLEETAQRLRNILGIIETLLNNKHVKTGNVGPHVSSHTVDKIMTTFEEYLNDVGKSNRSDTDGSGDGRDDR